MYIVVVAFINGSVSYHGPFPNYSRASQYGSTCEESYSTDSRGFARWFIQDLIRPHCIDCKIEVRF